VGNVDNTEQEIEDHESKDNPHPKSASVNDTTSTSEVQTQTLAYHLLGGL
jgi:hypothetical protein